MGEKQDGKNTLEAVDGRDIDNGPAVDDIPQLGPHAVHCPGQVDANNPIPFIVVEL
jgi:hypothetical protein